MGPTADGAEDLSAFAIEVVIEVPRGSRNKYEFDHDRHVMHLDRRLFSATVYPADYGSVPDTLAEDGDPLDAMVLVEDPVFPRSGSAPGRSGSSGRRTRKARTPRSSASRWVIRAGTRCGGGAAGLVSDTA